MPRASETVDDRTPLTASRIDVSARIGWLLRTSRSTAGLSLRQMSLSLKERGVTLSPASLSRFESEGQPSVAALDGYARVLGLPDGALRVPVNLLCRTFGYAPAPPSEPLSRDLDRFSRACEAVAAPDPTGGEWLDFARQHADGSFGLPRTLMEPHVRRLAVELARAVAGARYCRAESLTLLRRSAYGDVVEAVAREIVADSASQNFWDLMWVVAERPTTDVLHWSGGLLSDPSLYRVRGACYALQAMLVAGGLSLQDWAELVPYVARACDAAGDDPAKRKAIAQLCAALPPSLQAEVRATTSIEPPAPPSPKQWSRSRTNVHYAFAESAARAVTGRVGHADEPMLARLLFEAMYDPRGVRMSNATVLLAFSPFAATLVDVLLAERETAPGPAGRAAAIRIAAFCHAGADVPDAWSLLDSPDDADFDHALTMVGRSGGALPGPALERGLAGDEMMVRRTVYCLGMAGDRRIETIAADPCRPEPVRRAAGWWVREGARILT